MMGIGKKIWVIGLLVLFTGNPAWAGGDLGLTSKLYQSMFRHGQANTAELTMFFTQMPKGGDLHHHYTGSIYAETYLDWAKRKGWWINPCTLRVVTSYEKGSCESLTVAQLEANDALYRKLLTLWSDKDYGNHYHDQPPPDKNFFDTFGYFGTVSDQFTHEGLEIIKQRAINENVSYIETMLSKVPVYSSNYFSEQDAVRLDRELREAGTQEQTDRILERIASTLGNHSKFLAKVRDYVSWVARVHQGIDSHDFLMRFQTYASRVNDPLQVFINLYAGFMAASRSPLIVGVNIVAPENNHVALADYTLHMRMFHYLHREYPKVHRALHAGELTLGMVRPRDLLFHIRQALEIAGAERIGHAIDLPYEQNAPELLAELKKAGTAIEINLTSNQFILGVKGWQHPYTIYAAYGVPIVISTDDSGVSRNNLSNEYMLLASRYHPSYRTIKRYVYNSIQYSFLSPADKAAERRLLDKKFARFEKEMAELEPRLVHR